MIHVLAEAERNTRPVTERLSKHSGTYMKNAVVSYDTAAFFYGVKGILALLICALTLDDCYHVAYGIGFNGTLCR